MILEKCKTKKFESSTAFFKATQIKEMNPIFQSLTISIVDMLRVLT